MEKLLLVKKSRNYFVIMMYILSRNTILNVGHGIDRTFTVAFSLGVENDTTTTK